MKVRGKSVRPLIAKLLADGVSVNDIHRQTGASAPLIMNVRAEIELGPVPTPGKRRDYRVSPTSKRRELARQMLTMGFRANEIARALGRSDYWVRCVAREMKRKP